MLYPNTLQPGQHLLSSVDLDYPVESPPDYESVVDTDEDSHLPSYHQAVTNSNK